MKRTEATMAGEKTLVLVCPHGFCAGVERAVKIAERLLQTGPHPVYCLKEIVHNRQIVDALARGGIRFVNTLNEVPRGATVLFSAHGVSPEVRDAARALDLRVVDATCPFVGKVHAEVRRYAALGFTILLIGHRRHDEIVGVAGEAPDRVRVVENEAEAEQVAVSDPGKVAAMSQTTLSVDETTRVLDVLRRRFPALKTPPQSDICYATFNRQQAVRMLAPQVDLLVVLGAENSSNSNRLVEVARSAGREAVLVSAADQLPALPLDKVRTLGLTAGASTPETFVREAVAHLETRGFTRVETRTVVEEDVHFALPSTLQPEKSS